MKNFIFILLISLIPVTSYAAPDCDDNLTSYNEFPRSPEFMEVYMLFLQVRTLGQNLPHPLERDLFHMIRKAHFNQDYTQEELESYLAVQELFLKQSRKVKIDQFSLSPKSPNKGLHPEAKREVLPFYEDWERPF